MFFVHEILKVKFRRQLNFRLKNVLQTAVSEIENVILSCVKFPPNELQEEEVEGW